MRGREPLALLTKAGGFGPPDLFVSLAEGGGGVNQPVLGVTMGDPAGVGPEIIARAGAERSVRAASRPVVFGAAATMREALALVGSPLTLHAVERIADCRWAEGTLEVLDFANVDMATLPRCEVSAAAGRAGYEYLERARFAWPWPARSRPS